MTTYPQKTSWLTFFCNKVHRPIYSGDISRGVDYYTLAPNLYVGDNDNGNRGSHTLSMRQWYAKSNLRI